MASDFGRSKKTIYSLPNELLRMIFTKLEVNRLIMIRVVCRSWMAMIEHICREKRSIVIESDYQPVNLTVLSNRFNGLVDFVNNCTIIKMQYESFGRILLSKEFCHLLVNLFPQIENLVFNAYLKDSTSTTENLIFLLDQWSTTIVNLHLSPNCSYPESHHIAVYDQMDKLTNLKRLYNQFVHHIPNPLTLSRLQHCTFSNYDMHHVVPLLGKSCTSLNLLGLVSIRDIIQLPKLNARLEKCLTHLRLITDLNSVLPFVCINFTALKMLDIDFGNSINFNENMIDELARLPYLAQLSIDRFWIYLPTLTLSNMPTLNSVRILSISRFVFPNNDHRQFPGDQFCGILSSIFPCLQQFTIKHQDPGVRDGIFQNLGHFVHLRKHLIVTPEYE